MSKDLGIFNKCIEDLKKQKAVPQHGKDYYTVATRHSVLMNNFSGRVSINSEIINSLCCEHKVAVKATINIDNYGSFSGLALERYDSSFINKTSALENAETSALGRALAAFGLHGSEFASADELMTAKLNQNIKKEIPKVQTKSNGSAKINIEERIKKIQSDFDNKKNSSVLERDCALLKSELNKAGRWDEFKNSDKFLAFKQLDNKITKQKQKERK
tara:strand:- start:209 stop:859 length:651 start_codon:yes stop_codon:yes gene_type:complete